MFYTVEYLSGNEVSATIVADKVPLDSTLTLKGEAFALEREGYVHKGWSKTPNGPLAYNFGDTYSNHEDLVLYPHWVKATSYGAVTVYTYENDDGRKEAVIDGNSEEDTNIPGDIENVTSVQFDRTFPVGSYSTIVLPFDITIANTHGAKFNILKNISGNFETIELGQKTEQLHAYEPYVVEASSSTLTFDGPVTLKKTVPNDKTVLNNSDWHFRAAFKKFTFGDTTLYGRAYGFAGKAVDEFTVGQFVKAGKKAYINPLRGFLVYEGELNGSATKSAVGSGFGTVLPDEINVVVQDEQGNIVERGVLNTKTGEFRMDRWYDLQGRKLNGQPKVQGTYYRNGKRVIVK